MEGLLMAVALVTAKPQEPIQTNNEYANILTVERPTLLDKIEHVAEEKQKEIDESKLTPEERLARDIEQDVNNCEPEMWISAEDASCIEKKVQQVTKASVTSQPVRSTTVSSGNTYTGGQCTWHTKNVLGWVPNGWGNAANWAYHARAQGYTVSNTPIVGAVAQRSGGLGHVAAVIAVGDGTVTVSEMNYNWTPYAQRTKVVPVSQYQYIY